MAYHQIEHIGDLRELVVLTCLAFTSHQPLPKSSQLVHKKRHITFLSPNNNNQFLSKRSKMEQVKGCSIVGSCSPADTFYIVSSCFTNFFMVYIRCKGWFMNVRLEEVFSTQNKILKIHLVFTAQFCLTNAGQ